MGTLTVDNIVVNSGVGKISQVVQTVKTDNFSTTSTTFVDVTGFSVITPSNTSSKALIMINMNSSTSGGNNV